MEEVSRQEIMEVLESALKRASIPFTEQQLEAMTAGYFPAAPMPEIPKLRWEKLHTDGSDELSVSASFMGITFYVELREDGEYDLSVMIKGELHELFPMAIKSHAIKFMEGKFREIWNDPHDAEKYVQYWSENPENEGKQS